MPRSPDLRPGGIGLAPSTDALAGKDLATPVPSTVMRAKLDVDDLIKIVLVLVAIWLALEIVGEFLDTLRYILSPLGNVLGLIVLLLLVLWLLDRI